MTDAVRVMWEVDGGTYRVGIRPVVVERETTKFVWVRETWGGKTTVRKAARTTSYFMIVETWDEAREILRVRFDDRIATLEAQLAKFRERRADIEALTPPDSAVPTSGVTLDGETP